MADSTDNRPGSGEPRIHRDAHARRLQELEQELEIARRQAELERTRAEAVVQHLATQNHILRQRPERPAQPIPARQQRGRAIWRLAGYLVGRLGSFLFGLLSCAGFLLLILLVWAYWPELSAAMHFPQH